MNKKEQIKKQTWIYFIQQKIIETLVISLGIGILYLLSYIGRWIDVEKARINSGVLLFEAMDTFWKHMAYGILGLVITLLTIVVIGLLVEQLLKI